jgi:HK97 family phage portal protein
MGLKNIISKFLGIQTAQKIATQSTMIGGLPVYSNYDTLSNIYNGYVTSDDVYSIVRRIARTAAMVPLCVYKVKDENAMKEYEFASKQTNYSTQDMLRKEVLKLKALEKVTPSNPLQKLLDNPNPVYSKTEFNEGAYTFRLITGNTYIHTPLLELGVNAGRPLEMWLLPSQFMSLQVSDTWPRKVLYYRLQIADLMTFPIEDVIHLRYFNPLFNFVGQELIGMSPLRAGAKILDRQQAETDYSVNAFQNSGISGIISNESFADASTESLGKMKADFYNEATGTGNARKLLFTLGKMNYTAIGLGPVDMDVLNSEIRTFKKLCNLYGVSDILFNNDSSSTESNVKEMIKQMYTNAALPEVYAYRDALNMSLTPKFNTKGEKYFIDCDITSIPELQDDMKDMANIFSSLPIMIPNIIAKAYGWGEINEEGMDKVYVKNGYTQLDDMGPVNDLPITPDYEP